MYTLAEKICILFGIKGVSAGKYFQVWNLFDDADDFIANFGKSEEAQSILLDAFKELATAIKKEEYENYVEKLYKHEVVAVTHFSSDYPEMLCNIVERPYILFCKGDTRLLNSDCISIIGTRKVSSYGRRVAHDFTALLSEKFTIVSGLAYGVDAIAHETALETRGKTIAVLGSGLLNIYPSDNQGLADKIVQNDGLLVSEYGLVAPPFTYRFPQRNRIVAGLSRGVLVCQAPDRSGTNSTVELALDQGKDVFVVPGEIYDLGFAGNNRLIKTIQGACVTTPRDILDYYGLERGATASQGHQMSIEEQTVVNALSDGQMSFDDLVMKTGIAPGELNFLLANLELRSIIAKLAGNVYRLYGGIK